MATTVSVLVKSFNRPFYLDRCLRSIFDKISGDFTVTVLDDGTPPRYLEEIQRRHPQVRFERSELYDAKVAQIEAHVAGEGAFTLRNIPTKLWRASVQAATPIFCLLEDDIWLTGAVDLSELADYMQSRQIVMTKFYWGGNITTFEARMSVRSHGVQEYELVLPDGPEWWLRTLLLNKFKLHSILHRLGLAKDGIYFQLPFYSLYSVASAAFDKSYWLNLWPAGQQKANEVHQLARALRWTRQKPTRFAKSEQELTQTSFTSSATNTYEGVEFDVIVANYYLNEAWLKGEFDVMQNYPHDLDPEYLRPVLEAAADPRCTYANWLRWIARFKQIYASMGVVVD
jgi:glycosyltransferase involved in cell wall biosynthesis